MLIRTIIIFFCFASYALQAKNLELVIDAASFRYDESNSLWEVYYSFPDSMLTYKNNGDSYTGELFFSLSIETQTSVAVLHEWIVTHNAEKLEQIGNLKLTGQKNFMLPFGQYKASLFVKDLADTNAKASLDFDIYIRQFSKDRLSISDVELAQFIEKDGSTTQQWKEMFLKNSLYVVPNPYLIFFGNKPDLLAYFEIYNAKTLSPVGVNIFYTVFDAVYREVFSFNRFKASASDGLVETISLPLDAIPSGLYYLKVSVDNADPEISDTVSTIKRFYLINPDMPVSLNAFFSESATFEASEFSAMTPERTDIEMRQALIIASKEDAKQAEMLTETKAKQRFLYKFWQLRDPDPTTRINEKRDEFLKAIEYADTYFKYGNFKEGWRTERGRVLLKYGFPTRRDRTPAIGENRAYETWFFAEVQGGSYFHFVDIQGFGRYILVHSTIIGEPRDDSWFEKYVAPNTLNESQRQQMEGGNTYR